MQVVKIKSRKSFVIISIIALSFMSAFIGAVFMKFLIGDCSVEKDIIEYKTINSCEKEIKEINEYKKMIKECLNTKKRIDIVSDEKYYPKKENFGENNNKDVVIVINSRSVVEPKYVGNNTKTIQKTTIKKKQITKRKVNREKIKKPAIIGKEQKKQEVKIFIAPKNNENLTEKEVIKDENKKVDINIKKKKDEEQEIHNKIIIEDE